MVNLGREYRFFEANLSELGERRFTFFLVGVDALGDQPQPGTSRSRAPVPRPLARRSGAKCRAVFAAMAITIAPIQSAPQSVVVRLLGPLKSVDSSKNSIDPLSSEFFL
jgi:hypothetical protein